MKRRLLFFVMACAIIGLGSSCVEEVRPPASVSAFFNGRGDDLRERVVGFISSAGTTREPLDVAAYNLSSTETQILTALTHADSQTAVRVLICREGGSDESGAIATLLAGGVEVWTIKSQMHHKFAVSGPLVLTGSTNWTKNSLEDEANNLVIIEGGEIADQYRAEFTRLLAKADPATP